MEYGSIKVSGLRFVAKRDMTAFFIDKGRIVERRCYEKKQILFYSCCRCLMVFGLSMSAQAKTTYTLEREGVLPIRMGLDGSGAWIH